MTIETANCSELKIALKLDSERAGGREYEGSRKQAIRGAVLLGTFMAEMDE